LKLSRSGGRYRTPEDLVVSVDSIPSDQVLDVQGSLDRFGGDKGLFAEMTALLLEDAPELFQRLHAAVVNQDVVAVEQKAHALKGLLANCGGVRAAEVAQRLEDAGHHRDLERAPELINALKTELAVLADAIHAYQA
jgi:HPt (histidine-containing phosphotransfer) domain-containing protein